MSEKLLTETNAISRVTLFSPYLLKNSRLKTFGLLGGMLMAAAIVKAQLPGTIINIKFSPDECVEDEKILQVHGKLPLKSGETVTRADAWSSLAPVGVSPSADAAISYNVTGDTAFIQDQLVVYGVGAFDPDSTKIGLVAITETPTDSTFNIGHVNAENCTPLGIDYSPENNMLFVQTPLQLESLEVLDISGKVIKEYNGAVPGGISFESMSSGVYIVRTTTKNGGEFSKKILVQ